MLISLKIFVRIKNSGCKNYSLYIEPQRNDEIRQLMLEGIWELGGVRSNG